MTDTYREQVWRIIHSIPQGKVTSYGEVAKLAGLPRGARLIGRILSQLPPGSTLPWHRVVNAQGRSSFPAGSEHYREQRVRLLDEGVVFRNDRIDWRLFGWSAHSTTTDRVDADHGATLNSNSMPGSASAKHSK
jgi:methylated-DNA-protein-cysteine methyltransferase-like protein